MPPQFQVVLYQTILFALTVSLIKKMEIIANYRDEIFKHAFPRSETAVRSQCQLRATMAGCQFAKAFMVVKEIIW